MDLETEKEIISLAKKKYTPKEISEKLDLPVAAIFPTLRDKKLMHGHEDITKEAIEVLRHDNMEVAEKIGMLTAKTMDKATQMIDAVETPDELLTIVKVADMVAKIRGMIPKEAQTNIQVNNIIGFEFVSIAGQEDLVQIEDIH